MSSRPSTKDELAAIERFVANMAEAKRRGQELERRYEDIERQRDLRPDRRRERPEDPAAKAEVARAVEFLERGAVVVSVPTLVDRGAVRLPSPRAVSPPRPAPHPTPPSLRKVSRWATADWYELLLAPRGLVAVPEGCLITGGDRAWRRAEVP